MTGTRLGKNGIGRFSGALMVTLIAAAAFASRAYAADEKPVWLSDDVVVAAMTIGMTKDQLTPFRETVFKFLEDYGDETRRILRRNEPQLELHIDRACEALAKQMDIGMARFLSEEQMVPYQDYRRELIAALDDI